MNRRKLIKTTSLSLVGLSIPTAGYWWLQGEPNTQYLTFDVMKKHINQLTQKANLSSQTSWSVGKTFAHIAQSIELSIFGYPEHKSDTFKSTLGHVAFKAFARKGEMSHSLDEVIPGAKLISEQTTIMEGLEQLNNSVELFEQYQGDLKPHFAYGQLNKREYEIAHVLHFNNHLKAIH